MQLLSRHTKSKPAFTAEKDKSQSFSFGSNTKPAIPFFQAKLSLNSPGDVYEKEADEVANQVMSEKPVIQRKCTDCDKEEEKTIQRKPLVGDITQLQRTATSGSGNVDEGTETAINQTRGGGEALSKDTQQFMEDRFGSDFSSVRIHKNAEAAHLNQLINARAFTTGNDIYFNEGEFSPDTNTGRHLLAHELTHVVQQGGNKSQVQKHDSPSLWCTPFMELIDYEAKYGKLWVLWRYNSFTLGIFGDETLIPLNYNIPSYLGDVDMDWMFRLACTQYAFYFTSNIFPTWSEYFAAKASRNGYFVLKGTWNFIRGFFPQWNWDLASIYETGNWNAAPAVTRWLFGTGTLADLFDPAVTLCKKP